MRLIVNSIFFFIALAGTVNNASGQKKLVVMGSSTAAGIVGPSSYANSFVGRTQAYYRQNMSDGLDTVVTNIAVGGQNSYDQLPNGFPQVPGRPYPPDQNTNVNRAMSFFPDVVIINLPSNDIASGFTKEEFMGNLRKMYNAVTANGTKCYITTTQPRDVLNEVQRQMQRALVDSINNAFTAFSINFWTDIATPDNFIKPAVNYDGTHVNDAGHNLLFLRVRDKAIFSSNIPLPVKLTAFSATLNAGAANIYWQTEQEDPFTFYELQRSSNGQLFETIYRKQAFVLPRATYNYPDRLPLPGKSFYRLKIIEQGHESYSQTITVNNKSGKLSINKIYSDLASGNMLAEISITKSQAVELSIVNSTGAVISKQSQFISGPAATVSLPISRLSNGTYFLRIKTAAHEDAVKAFSKAANQ